MIVEQRVLRGEQLRRIVKDIVIEDIGSPLHSLVERLIREEIHRGCFFGINVPTLYEEFLELE
jgi:hypothetical protein